MVQVLDETLARHRGLSTLDVRAVPPRPSADQVGALRKLAGTIDIALVSGDYEDALWLARQLQERLRRNWLKVVEWGLANPDCYERVAQRLRAIAQVETDATKVLARLYEYRTAQGKKERPQSAAAVAARIAVDFGAFGYTNVRTAKAAFVKMTPKTP